MKGSFQPTRPGFSASNAGLRASSTAVRRSQDRGSATSRQLPHTVKVAVTQREEYGPIGLELSKDLDMVQWLQQQLSTQQGPLYSAAAPAVSRTLSRGWNVEPLAVATPPQKAAATSHAATPAASAPKSGPLLKAKTLPMLQMVIGGWQRGSKFEGDLVLKCYFTKKKLCWEILDGNLTFKCEMRWPEIQYMRSSQGNNVELLELDVRQPPAFYEELEPQAKKRAVWKACQDFTGGQVSMGKRQQFTFLPGKLCTILPDFFALNQHLRHDHEQIETPHAGPSDSSEEVESQLSTKSVQHVYTEQDLLTMLSQGRYAYPQELPAELTSPMPSSSQSASCNTSAMPATSVSEQEHSSSADQCGFQIEEVSMDLGEPNPLKDSLDIDLSDLPPSPPSEMFWDSLVGMDSADIGLPQSLASSLALAAQQHVSTMDEGDIVDELLDLDAMCC